MQLFALGRGQERAGLVLRGRASPPRALRRHDRRRGAARDSLTQFDEQTTLERARLEVDLADARNEAAKGRFGLLYGSGRPLVRVVQDVLERAGLTVEDLDERLGEGVSGDLLASSGGRHWLLEVKGKSGSAGEDLVADLEKHLRTWPEMGRPEQLAGGVLIVNHQHGRDPLDRQPEPYARAEFVRSLPCPVIPTLALFGWWKDRDDAAIVQAVTGPPGQYRSTLAECRA